ncbi:LacI family DNA-binding transcriptional regulator [Pedobacter hiemivivus]|uniref:LacI family transcriptional regulator n=1 Tax=Pedobacter hiemivivus TaxID=2530454 RepID=A0A4R0NJM1_9SPHI|nr:LacI family DNA-binding transcriptional regulator [Pedobacter hiemivivus]TCC99632.1 LacI family transcriptional regulator [Pedobacter hiemivivus]
MKNINIRELALELNLSVSTVSKALNDSYEISEETKRRVLETAARLNYVPNPYASSLRGRKSKNIGVVIPEVADSFFSLAINGIESVAKEKGYHVLICLTHESFENERTILKEFQGGRVDGVLLSVSRETTQCNHISDLIANGLPLVFFDRACDNVETAKITTDDFESAYKATAHLIQQNCDQIAFLSISKSLSISNKRLEGYLQALSDYQIKVDQKYIIHCSNDAEQNYLLIKKLLQQKNKPNGIIASVEKLTTPVYMACEALKLKVPKDVKIVCFSNLETAAILNPSLTTITQPAFEMGKTAATLLFRALENRNFSLIKEDFIIPSTLVVRGSTSH